MVSEYLREGIDLDDNMPFVLMGLKVGLKQL